MLIVDASYRAMYVIIHKFLINSKHNNAIMELIMYLVNTDLT